MSMQVSPTPREETNFQFKLLCRLRAFPSSSKIKLDNPVKLVATASKYGLTFVGSPNGVQCISTGSIIDLQRTRPNNRGNITDYQRRELLLGCQPLQIDVSCDNEFLGVTVLFQNCPVLYVYSVTSFGSKEIAKKFEVRLSNTPGVNVVDLQWNPGVANMLGAVLTDGSVIGVEFKGGSFAINSLPPNVMATCLCWSPKGKQIVIGSANGSLTQYKPELKSVKTFPSPQISNNPLRVISVQWLSSFQFLAVYRDAADASQRPCVMIVNVPKGGSINYVNYEDILYGADTIRPEHHFIHQLTWNIVLLGCSNSMELGVLAQQGDTMVWEQWLQDEATRAELPLTENHEDVYNVGIAFDLSTKDKIPIGENRTVDPMPIVCMLSHEGVLSLFYTMNLIPNSQNICSPPQPLPDQSGLCFFTIPQAVQAPASLPQVTNPLQQLATPGIQTPAATKILPSGTPGLNTTAFPFSQSGFFASTPAVSSSTQPPPALVGPQVSAAVPPTTMPPKSTAPPLFSAQPGSLPAFSVGPTSQFSFTTPASTQAPALGFGLAVKPTVSQVPPASAPAHPTLATTTSVPPLMLSSPATSASSLQFGSPATSTPVQALKPTQSTSIPSTQPQTPIQPSPHLAQAPPTKPAQISQVPPQPPTTSQPATIITTKPQGTKLDSASASAIGLSSTAPIIPLRAQEASQPISPLTHKVTIVPVTPKSSQQSTKLTKVEKKKDDKKSEKSDNAPEVQDIVYKRAVLTEVANFMADLEGLKGILGRVDVNIGDEAMKKELKLQTDTLEMFGKDLKETTATQEAEVSALRANITETFSWLENIQTKHSHLSDPDRYIPEHEAEDLDPISKRHIKSIEQSLAYLERQIRKVNVELESIWSSQKDKTKSRLEAPSLERIFETITKLYNIVQSKKALIDELESAMSRKENKSHSILAKVGDIQSPKLKSKPSATEISSLTKQFLNTKLSEGVRETNGERFGNLYGMVINRKLSINQENALKDWHDQHRVIHTRVTKRPVISKEMLESSISLPKDKEELNTKSAAVAPTSMITATTNIIPKDSQNITNFGTPTGAIKVSQPQKSLFTISSGNKQPPTAETGFFGSIKNQTLAKETEVKNKPAEFGRKTIPAPQLPQQTMFTVANQATPVKLDAPNLPVQNITEVKPEPKQNIATFNFGVTPSQQLAQTAPTIPSIPCVEDIPEKAKTPSTTSLSMGSLSLASPENKIVPNQMSGMVTPQKETNTAKAFNFGSVLQKPELEQKSTTSTVIPPKTESGSAFTFGQVSIPGKEQKPVQTASTNIFGGGGKATALNTFNFNIPGNIFGSTTATSAPTISFFGNARKTAAPTTISGGSSSGVLSSTGALTIPTPSKPSTTAQVGGGSAFSGTGGSTLSGPLFGGLSLASSSTPSAFVSTTSSTPSIFGGQPLSLAQALSTPAPASPTITSTAATAIVTTTTTTTSAASNQIQQSVVQPDTAVEVSSTSTPQEVVTTSNSTPTTAPPPFPTSAPSSTLAQTVPAPTPTFPTQTSIATTSTTSSSVPFSVPPTSSTPLFGSVPSTTSSSIFGAPAGVTVFSSPAVTTTSSSLFGAPTPTVTSEAPAFGTPTSSSAPAVVTPTTSAPPSIFGTPSTSASLFKTPTATTASTSVFGLATPTTSAPAIFGNPASPPPFGSQTPTTTSSVFGMPPSFGTPTTTTPAFGTPASTTSTSVFGTPSTQSPSIFGGQAFSAPPTSTAFGTPTTSASTFFGQPICNPTTTSTSVFGTPLFSQVASTNVFGGGVAFSKPLFGQSNQSGLFGQPKSNAGNFGTSGGSMFGGGSFSSSPQQQQGNFFQSPGAGGGTSIFGGGGSGGGGAFSGGGQSVGQSGFGASPSFQNKPTGNVFGGSGAPAFGTQASFGSPPTFGGAASFGSPNKVFGSPPQQQQQPTNVGFNALAGNTSTFENLASQNTMTFGNLAQNQQPQPGFGSSFGAAPPPQQPPPQQSAPQFGGSSFNTWR